MRWISILILPVFFGACTALKPVIAKKAGTNIVRPAHAPSFLENIIIYPSPGSPIQTAAVINNNTTAPAFGSQHETPAALLPVQFKYAILMDMPVETLHNLKLFAFIDDWYGTPYRFGGSSKKGIDCSAFSGNLMSAVFGTDLPRMARDQYNISGHVQKNNLEEGDLVFFHTTRKGVSHVGIYLGNNKFVHASLNYGVTISDLGDGYYARTFIGGGRVKQNATPAEN